MVMDWLTPSVFTSWDTSGKSTFLKEVKSIGKEVKQRGEQDYDAGKHVPLERNFYKVILELIRQGCKGNIRKESFIPTIKEIIHFKPTLAALIADVFSAADLECVPISTVHNDTYKKNFQYFSTALQPVLVPLFGERIEYDTIVDRGQVPHMNQFQTRYIRTKTKIYFKQRKFNLFREESEGYSKIVTELNQMNSETSVSYVIQVVQCLIGRFYLDPNRVLDLVLVAFESRPSCKFFIPMLQQLKSSRNTISEVLGLKLTSDTTNESLFIVIALLIEHDIITLEEIYQWLSPDDNVIRKDWDRELKEAKEYARKSMIVCVNKEAVEDSEEMALKIDRYSDNQKFLLCEALLSIGAWSHAQELLRWLPDFSCVSNRRIALAFAEYLHYVLDPLYRRSFKFTCKSDEENFLLENSFTKPQTVTSIEEFANYIPMLKHLGPYIHYDPTLVVKIIRIMTANMEQVKHSEPNSIYYGLLSVLEEVILPSLNYFDGNCGMAQEVWGIVKLFPYHQRFRLYGSWKGENSVLGHPTLLRKRVDMVKKIKHIMRRISKENVKPMGRYIGKYAHSMPVLIFDYVLSQIQLFDNLIHPVIDALKFLSPLSYDVLCYCLLEALSPGTNNSRQYSLMLMPNRARTKHDGSTIAPWLQSLASFTGSICKKYSIELVPILQYVANQLKSKQSLDLLILKEIVQKMTGIEASEEMTTEQLDALGGGDLLRGEAGYFGQVRASKKSSNRLREAASVSDLAISLCILMGQQRNCIVFDDSQSLHTKLVGKLYDQCQDTLVQFGNFLATSFTLDDYAKKIPSLEKLVDEFHVSSDVAFFLWRPLLTHRITSLYDHLRRSEKPSKRAPSSVLKEQKQEKYAEASNAVLSPVVEIMRNFLPPKSWEDISPQFFVTFWSLTIYDLHIPTDAYAREINRIKQMSIAASDNKDMPSSKRKKEQERCQNLIDKLQNEELRQREHVNRVMAKLNKEKDSWFASRTAKTAKNETVTAFLQMCLFPRCIYTASDALYCAHFVNTIHSLSTPNFSTLICYDRIFCDIIYTVTSCTENEANRYGRFLCALLGTVMKWHSQKSVFDKECASFPGFVTKFRASNTNAESSDHVDYENFRHVCHKWHYKITKCVIVCLESKDFIQIRNSLIVLKRILPYFPRVSNLAAAVEKWIERVRTEEKDKRQDLFALATSYIAQLKLKQSTLVDEGSFHQRAPLEKQKPPPRDDKDKDRLNDKDVKKKITKEENSQSPALSTVSGSSSNTTKTVNGTSSVGSGPGSPTKSTCSTPTNTNSSQSSTISVKSRKEDGELEVDPPYSSRAYAGMILTNIQQTVLAKFESSSKFESVPESIRITARRVADIAGKEPKKRKLDKNKEEKEKLKGTKEKGRRGKPKDSKSSDKFKLEMAPTSLSSNGGFDSPSGSKDSPALLSSLIYSAREGLDRDKDDKKRDKRRADRKRDARPDTGFVEPKRRRSERPDDFRIIKGSRPGFNLGNGELMDRDKYMKDKDRSPRHSPHDRPHEMYAKSSSSSKHMRYNK